MATFPGTSGNDTLTGGSENDILQGEGGDDYLLGGAGDDVIDGGADYDFAAYTDATGAVSVNLALGTASGAGVGADTLISIEDVGGSSFDDILTGGNAASADYEGFSGLAGNDTINGGGGFDRSRYDNSPASVSVTLGGTGNGTASDGWGGTDTLVNISSVRGSAFNDSLTGSDTGSFEEFEGMAGDDVIDGKGGADLVRYNRSPTAVTADLVTGVAQDGWGGTDGLLNIERLRGSEFDDTLSGNASNNVIDGRGGNDSLFAGAGYDELYGGSGNDVLDASAGDASTEGSGDYIRPGSGSNTIIGSAALFNGNGGINLSYREVAGSGGLVITVGANGTGTVVSNAAGVVNDTFSYAYWFEGSSQSDSMTGSANSNYEGWSGLAGADTLDGADGWDELYYANDVRLGGQAAVSVNFETGQAIDGFGNVDTFSNMESVRGTALADTFIGSSAIDFLSYRGLAGNDTITGSSSVDRVDYSQDANNGGLAAVVVNLATGVATDGFGNTDTLIDIDDIRGSNYADTLTGNAAANNLEGRGGNDILIGGAGNDSLYGGADDDQLEGGEGDDYLDGNSGADAIEGGLGDDYIQGADGSNDTLDGGEGFDIVSYYFGNNSTPFNFTSSGTSTQNDGLGGTDTLLNFEELHVFGGSVGDTLVGDAKRNYIMGNGGNDTLSGGGGNDTFSFDPAQASGVDRITDFSADDNLSFQNLVLTSLSGIGNANALGQGAVLVGTPTGGITTVYVGTDAVAGADLSIELQGNYAAADFVFSNDSYGASISYVPGNVITGTPGDDTLNGTTGADIIDGLAGDDFINGNSGADTIKGGLGDDYIQGSDGDNDILDGGDGYDVARYSFSSSNTPVNFTASGTSIQNDGLGGTDTLLNFEELDILGGSADDTLVGDARSNYILGNGGNDTLSGGGGYDGFSFEATQSSGVDRITDFSADDVLLVRNLVLTSLSGIGNANALGQGAVLVGTATGGITTIYVGTDAVAGADLSIELQGNYAAADFVFGNYSYGASIDYVPGSVITGTPGNDTLTNTSGADTINGLAGLDTANYTQNLAAYTVLISTPTAPTSASVADLAITGPEGNDTLTSIERLHFADINLAFDIDANAGQVYRLYQAAFNRTPDVAGLGGWIAAMDNGTPLLQIASSFMASAEFQSLYGTNPSNEAFVSNLYTNALHRPAQQDAGSAAGWVSQLASNQISRAQALVNFSESAENKASVLPAIVGGITYATAEQAAGLAQGQTYTGTPNADNFIGTIGKDSFTGGEGNDSIEGGRGLDTAIYSGNQSTHTITRTATGLTVSGGTDGSDTLSHIERLQFADGVLAFDIDGNAGQSYRLYQAAFNRTPDKGGLSDWVYGMDNGLTLNQMATEFIRSPEFFDRYGANTSNAEFIDLLYANALHRAREVGDNYWTQQLDSGVTREQALIGFSESVENQTALMGVIHLGISLDLA